jgi:chemotaxis protein methyltransferase CheR
MSIKSWEFDFFRRIIKEKSGIQLEEGKEYLVESRLRPVIEKEAGISNLVDLIALMRNQPNHPVVNRVIDAMTTNETLFFRDPPVYDTLRERILPDLIAARTSVRELSIWCCASSSGQEPYSLLMMLANDFPSLRDWKVRVIATDISPTMIERTRRGVYSNLEISRGLLPGYRDKYLTPFEEGWQIKPALRSALELRELNLAAQWPDLGRFDLVMLRNVLIYFDVPTKLDILRRVRQCMRPDGFMLLGGGETTLGIDDGFERLQVGRTQYYKIKDAKNDGRKTA